MCGPVDHPRAWRAGVVKKGVLDWTREASVLCYMSVSKGTASRAELRG